MFAHVHRCSQLNNTVTPRLIWQMNGFVTNNLGTGQLRAGVNSIHYSSETGQLVPALHRAVSSHTVCTVSSLPVTAHLDCFYV